MSTCIPIAKGNLASTLYYMPSLLAFYLRTFYLRMLPMILISESINLDAGISRWWARGAQAQWLGRADCRVVPDPLFLLMLTQCEISRSLPLSFQLPLTFAVITSIFQCP